MGLPGEASPSPLGAGSSGAVPGAWYRTVPPGAWSAAADEPIVVRGPRNGLPGGPGCDGPGDGSWQAGPGERDRFRFTALGIGSDAGLQHQPARCLDQPSGPWLGA